MGLLEEQGLPRPRLGEPARRRGDRRAAARGARAWSARSWPSSSPTPSAGWRGRWRRSKFVDEPWLERDLRGYFPPAVIERCGHLLAEHPLRRQLLCMVSSNSVVNALGPTFVSQLVAERGVRRRPTSCAPTGSRARSPARRRAGTRSSSLEGVEPRRPGRADGRRRRARRQRDPLVPRPGSPRATSRTMIAAGRDGLRAAHRGAAGPRHRGAPRAARADRRPARGRRRARGARPVPTRCAPSSRTRRTWSRVAARHRAATSRTSPRSSSPSAPSCGSTGSRPELDALPRALAGCSAGRCRPCARTPPRPAASSPRRALDGVPRPPPAEAVERFLAHRATRDPPARGFLRALVARGGARPRRAHARRPPAALDRRTSTMLLRAVTSKRAERRWGPTAGCPA